MTLLLVVVLGWVAGVILVYAAQRLLLDVNGGLLGHLIVALFWPVMLVLMLMSWWKDGKR